MDVDISSSLITIVIAIVVSGFLLVIVGMVVNYLQLRQIHSAVNSNMTTALLKIDELHGKVSEVEGELRHEKDKPKPRKRKR